MDDLTRVEGHTLVVLVPIRPATSGGVWCYEPPITINASASTAISCPSRRTSTCTRTWVSSASTAYRRAAIVVEAVTDTPLAVLVRDRPAEPLGLRRTTLAPTDPAPPERQGDTTGAADGDGGVVIALNRGDDSDPDLPAFADGFLCAPTRGATRVDRVELVAATVALWVRSGEEVGRLTMRLGEAHVDGDRSGRDRRVGAPQ